jgi:hypothetical protein
MESEHMRELTTRDLTTSIWWNPYTIEHIRLRTPLSPDECIRRIQANINSYKYWRGENWRTDDPAKRPFVGTAGRDRFTIGKNMPNFRSSFRPLAKGVMLPDPTIAEGAITDMRLSLSVFVRIWWSLLLIGFGVAFLLSCFGAAGVIDVGRDLSNPFLVLVAAGTAGIMFYPFYVLAFWFSRRERVFLVETLQRILDASDLYPDRYTGMEPGRPQ